MKTIKKSGRLSVVFNVPVHKIFNQVYGLELEGLRRQVEQAKEEFPRFTKVLDLLTLGGFCYGNTLLGMGISSVLGDVLGYTLGFSHSFLVRLSARYLRHKMQTETNEKFSIFGNTPGIADHSAAFSIAMLFSVPAYFATMGKVLELSDTTVSPSVAMASTLLATGVSIAIEYPIVLFFWRKFILKNMKSGSLVDSFKGFKEEFSPLKLFGISKDSVPTKTAYQYVGQLLGIGESNWFWSQILRVGFAGVLAAFFQIPPHSFIDFYMLKSAELGKGVIDGLVGARDYDLLIEKIEGNHECLNKL